MGIYYGLLTSKERNPGEKNEFSNLFNASLDSESNLTLQTFNVREVLETGMSRSFPDLSVKMA